MVIAPAPKLGSDVVLLAALRVGQLGWVKFDRFDVLVDLGESIIPDDVAFGTVVEAGDRQRGTTVRRIGS
jgi:hypothetical protein